MAKKFNPKMSAYKQLLSHRGKAIIIVVNKRSGEINRIRAVSAKREALKGTYYPRHSIFKYITENTYDYSFNANPNTNTYSSSCFDESSYSYKEVINGMRRFDKDDGLKIAHIDFYPA